MRIVRSGLAAAFVVLAVAWLIYGGFVRYTPGRHIDTEFWFAAAKCWDKGVSPYDFHEYQTVWKEWEEEFRQPGDCPFAYPTSAAILFWPMGWMDWPGGKLYFDLLNALSLVVIAACLALVGRLRPGHSPNLLAIAIAAALSSSGTLHTVFTGQTTIFVTAGISLIYAGSLYRKGLPVCVGVVLASMKPQLLVPILTWLILFGPCRKSAATGVVLASLSLLILWRGDSAPLAHLQESLRGFVAHPEMAPRNFCGLEPILDALGFSGEQIRMALAALGLATVAGLYAWLRGRGVRADTMLNGAGDFESAQLLVSILLCASILFGPARNYDLVLLAPTFLLLTMGGRFAVLAGALLAVIWKPALVGRPLGILFPQADLEVAVRLAVSLDVLLLMLLCLARLRAVIGRSQEGIAAQVSTRLSTSSW